MGQQTDLDFERSEAAKNQAIADVSDHADELWKVAARSMVYKVAVRMPTFTSDDVWRAGLPKPREPRALGAVFNQLAREGFIETTGEFRRTAQVLRHSAPVAVWRLKRER